MHYSKNTCLLIIILTQCFKHPFKAFSAIWQKHFILILHTCVISWSFMIIKITPKAAITHIIISPFNTIYVAIAVPQLRWQLIVRKSPIWCDFGWRFIYLCRKIKRDFFEQWSKAFRLETTCVGQSGAVIWHVVVYTLYWQPYITNRKWTLSCLWNRRDKSRFILTDRLSCSYSATVQSLKHITMKKEAAAHISIYVHRFVESTNRCK